MLIDILDVHARQGQSESKDPTMLLCVWAILHVRCRLRVLDVKLAPFGHSQLREGFGRLLSMSLFSLGILHLINGLISRSPSISIKSTLKLIEQVKVTGRPDIEQDD
jgi:hypothetical protein